MSPKGSGGGLLIGFLLYGDETETMKLVIGLLSCAKHDDRDELVRQTWLKTATELAIPVYFLRGGVVEFRQEQDTLYFPVPDTYTCLPQKTRAWMEWAVENTDADYIGKGDNDSLLIPDRLVQYDFTDKRYVGCEPGGRWRGYASGGAMYFVDRSLAQLISSELTAPSGPEDVLVGAIARQHRVSLFKDRRFVPWGNQTRRPLPENDIIASHQLSRELWMDSWKSLNPLQHSST